MNYYAARQRQKDGRWDWTRMNDKVVWASGPCADHEDGHATKEEAERHYYEWEMDRLKEQTYADTQHRCAVCGVWTQKELGPTHGTPEPLCDEHRTKEQYMMLHPFRPGVTIVSSW